MITRQIESFESNKRHILINFEIISYKNDAWCVIFIENKWLPQL